MGERTTATHELKCWPEYFQAFRSGAKTFELRPSDRPLRYVIGDLLLLREYDPIAGAYSGAETYARVTYVMQLDGEPFNVGDVNGGKWVCMSIVPTVGNDDMLRRLRAMLESQIQLSIAVNEWWVAWTYATADKRGADVDAGEGVDDYHATNAAEFIAAVADMDRQYAKCQRYHVRQSVQPYERGMCWRVRWID